MAVLKCKMCGGDVELLPDKTLAACEYCGCTMTFPKVDDDKRAAAFNRGNHFRRIGEFDKALAVYERIVSEDNTDAEAHWCCALCRFGIEYVEDPNSYEWFPTCHRLSYDSFLEDVDYLAAVEYSDGITQRQYKKDAAKIAEVQRGILATSQNEKPFDVFICYKETSENGDRTIDSTLAQDIYYQLTDKGYKVFFSRITLEDKVGTEYEPYIFAALQSAKVMLVVGTKAEHLNAVWVKNEWSRYLTLMKKDRSKVLLPCYRDMDAYDMPEQLSVLQSYDMSKIGFIQDLVRGIEKIVAKDEPKSVVQERVVVNNTGSANTAALLERAFIFLEDRKWEEADEYCEKVLDLEPKNAEAYLGKMTAELQIDKREELRNCDESFEDNDNYRKIVRFGDDNIRNELNGYVRHIIDKKEEQRLAEIYEDALKMLRSSASSEDCDKAAKMFRSIQGYKDSEQLSEEAERKRQEYITAAEEARKSRIYDEATALLGTEDVTDIEQFEKAIALYTSIIDYKDSRVCIELCHGLIKTGKEQIAEVERIVEKQRQEEQRLAEERRIEEERIAELERKERVKREKRNRIIVLIIALIVIFTVAGYEIYKYIISPVMKYNDAVALVNSGNYDDAIAVFVELGDYKDSYEQVLNAKYIKAMELISNGDYSNAVGVLAELGTYRDCAERYLELKPYDYKNAQIGDIVKMGSYEQDNVIDNGAEEIEWYVVGSEDGRKLLISVWAIETMQYSKESGTTNWSESDLRKWLNEDFYDNAFKETEKARILNTSNVTSIISDSDMRTNLDTSEDMIFVFSRSEVNKYLNNTTGKVKGTSYSTPFATHNYAWVRSAYSRNLPEVYKLPTQNAVGFNFVGCSSYVLCYVRPSMWIDIS